MNMPPLLARILLWKKYSSFTYLNITQLLVTLNDSVFRLLVAFSLINKMGYEKSSTIFFISGVVFVLPFLIFSMPAGELADKCSKKKVIAWSLVGEVVGMAYGIFAMHYQSTVNAYGALFVVALQASVFNPAKYAILPELVKREDISKVNGIMTLATYLAIILGTFFASFFTQITENNYTLVALFCFCIALLGLWTSLQIETTPVKNPEKRINPLFLIQVVKSLKLASKYPHLLLTVLASSYFVYTASFTQLNLIPLAVQSLAITDVQASYMFLAAALGVGIGATIVAIISGKHVELGIALWGAFGTSFSYIILYVFSHNLLLSILLVLSVGINGGLYIVPLDSYIQIASPEKDRGEIVASGSLLGFFGVLIASLCIGFFNNILHLSAAEGFLIVGLLSLGVSITILLRIPEYFTRFFAVSFFKIFYHITPINQPKIEFYESVLILMKKYSFGYILSILQLYHRVTFIRFIKKSPLWLFKPFYHFLHISPFPLEISQEDTQNYYERILNKKMPLCLFLEGKLKFKTSLNYQEAVSKFLSLNKQPIIPLGLKQVPRIKEVDTSFNLLKSIPIEIIASFGQKEERQLQLEDAAQLIKSLEQPKLVN